MTVRALLSGHAADVAPLLLGATVTSRVDGRTVAVRLTEVEAYGGVGEDPGSHAFRRRTARTASMFGPAGHAYVYFTYGMHWCLNVVTGEQDEAGAVLLRAGEVVVGADVARDRRRRADRDRDLARGPARLATALGVTGAFDGVDAAEVTAAARGLARFGLTWDATRLASQAALHSADGRISGAMLQLARDLKQDAALEAAADPVDVSASAIPREPSTGADVRNTTPPPASGDARATAAATPAWTRLSDREREVAELVLQGMPYRDIGARLLISAKTVEHHVARIRRRLGAESRSEMLSMLRALLVEKA